MIGGNASRVHHPYCAVCNNLRRIVTAPAGCDVSFEPCPNLFTMCCFERGGRGGGLQQSGAECSPANLAARLPSLLVRAGRSRPLLPLRAAVLLILSHCFFSARRPGWPIRLVSSRLPAGGSGSVRRLVSTDCRTRNLGTWLTPRLCVCERA